MRAHLAPPQAPPPASVKSVTTPDRNCGTPVPMSWSKVKAAIGVNTEIILQSSPWYPASHRHGVTRFVVHFPCPLHTPGSDAGSPKHIVWASFSFVHNKVTSSNHPPHQNTPGP
eukprot:TRINITY_DN12603_c0_g1_i4.p1 TRINITY_DN12603_c0_g1~~TRINITY_DN12603_c0_g1_i4.p1  ORF type:complete len:114 (-),score=11.25 TRINITY_DN12603_c0_g1_i4:99-440(-)